MEQTHEVMELLVLENKLLLLITVACCSEPRRRARFPPCTVSPAGLTPRRLLRGVNEILDLKYHPLNTSSYNATIVVI